MICAFNARGFLTDPAMKSAFGLNNKADSYGSLNGALVSDQDKDKFETCFVFNSEQMDSFASGKQRSRSNIIRMLERWMN